MKKVSFKQFQNELTASLGKFQNAFEKKGIFGFANSGTLLGAVREGGIIPGDDDADMGMFNDDFYKHFDKMTEIANDLDFTLFDPSKTRGLDVGRLFSNTTYLVEGEGEEYVTQIYFDINLALPIKRTNKVREKGGEIVNKYSGIYGDFYHILPKRGGINGKLKDIGGFRNFLVFFAKCITFLFMFGVPLYQSKKVKKIKDNHDGKYQFFYSGNSKGTYYKKNEDFFTKVKFEDFHINVIKDYKNHLNTGYGSDGMDKPKEIKRVPHNLILTPIGKSYKIRPFLIK